jgi:DNA repair exonuclease SbcCD ATPase subunit
MLLNRIHIRNFRRYQDFGYDFGPGITLFIGPNGIGKTSIAESLAWCLFGGKCLRTKQDDIVRDGEDEVRVTLEFNLRGERYVLTRIKSASGGRSIKGVLHCNGQKVVDSVSEIERFLVDMAHVDKERYDISYVTQGELDYLIYVMSSKKKELIASLFDVDRIDGARERISADYRAIREGLDSYSNLPTVTNLSKELGQKDNELGALSRKEKSLKTRLEALKKELDGIDLKSLSRLKKRESLLETLETYRQNLEGLRRRVKELDSCKWGNWASVQEEIKRLTDEQKLVRARAEYVNACKEFSQHLQEGLKKGRCPVCLSSVKDPSSILERFQEEIEVLEGTVETNQLISIERQISKLTDTLNREKNEKARVDCLRQELIKGLNEYTSRIQRIEESLIGFEDMSKEGLEDLIERHERLQKELQSLKEEERDLARTKGYLEGEIDRLGQMIEETKKVTKKRKQSEKEATILGELRGHMDSFRSWVLENLFRHISERTNNILHQLTGRYWSFQHDSDLNFFVDGGKPVERYSKGQIGIIALALRVALAEYLASRANYYGPLILDAVFDSLDSNHRLRLSQFLNNLRFPQIIIFSHFDPQEVAGQRFYLE